MRRWRVVLIASAVSVLVSSCQLYGWGANPYGQLGNALTEPRLFPTQSGIGDDWLKLAAGGGHACGIREGATLWCWGNNASGQLGDGTTTNRPSPSQIGAATNWKHVASGNSHGCAIRKAGTLWCWGENGQGQVGDGTTTNRTNPTRIGADTDWASVDLGVDHSCAIRTTGSLWCWGYNGQGQVGDGTTTNRTSPTQIGAATNWQRPGPGSYHTCAIRTTGSLWCWGWNSDGQLGDGTTTNRTTPTQIGAATNWAGVAGGRLHTCALRTAGAPWCWGDNADGQLGDGTTTPHLAPVEISAGSSWKAVDAGTSFTCALRTAGTAWCWGANGSGQLGDGTTTSRDTPTQSGVAANWQLLSVGAAFTLGLRSDGDPDSDGDRLPDQAETSTGVFVSIVDTGTNPNVADTDGDGIDDGDEVLGTLDGLSLASMGASPLKRNILLEFDWFDDANECAAHSHRPTPAAVATFEAAFAGAATPNPDGSTGIDVISDYGQGGAFNGGNLVADTDGVIAGGVAGADFLDAKAANFAANRNGYFHYVLLPHRYNTNSTSSGQAELPGDDLIVSLYCFGTTTNVANTIMHELGHNLNLRHGGNLNTNYKPNYNSVMNYRYQFPGVDNNCTPPGNGVLDYSYGVRITLNENNLDEQAGICGGTLFPVDWDNNAIISSGVVFDVNGDALFQLLADYNDWANVSFGGLGDGDGNAPLDTVEIVTEQDVPTAR